MWKRISALTDVRDANADTTTPYWITEVGVSTDTTNAAGVPPDRQGTELLNLYHSIEGHDIRSFIIHRLHELGPDESGERLALQPHGRLGVRSQPEACLLRARCGDRGGLRHHPTPDEDHAWLKGKTHTNSASFSFSSSEPGSSFECMLDAGAWGGCTSPKSYSNLASGQHTFSVRAMDHAGNLDASPAARTWTVQLKSGKRR